MSDLKLPETRLGDLTVSRLMVGGNPFSGNSHQTVELSNEMVDYYTTANIKKDLRECERCGITAVQLRGDTHIRRLLNEHWNEGGSVKWLAQTAPEMGDFATHVRQVRSWGASAIYHHGGVTDDLYAAGDLQTIIDRLKMMRDLGIPIGVGTHNPEILLDIESRGWDVDFYTACFYNISRKQHESFVATGRLGDEKFRPDDPPAMCDAVRQVTKPVVAFKILAAGRSCASPEEVRRAFQFAYGNIKPIDAVTVGVFTKRGNQIEENAATVREVLCAQV